MQVDIAHNYNAYHTSKGNILWVGTLSLAWHQLAKSQSLPTLELNTHNTAAQRMIKNLNESPFKEEDISGDSVYLKAGMGPDTIASINKEVKEKFPKYSFPDLTYRLAETDIISFAYLFKQITFAKKF